MQFFIGRKLKYSAITKNRLRTTFTLEEGVIQVEVWYFEELFFPRFQSVTLSHLASLVHREREREDAEIGEGRSLTNCCQIETHHFSVDFEEKAGETEIH